MAVHYLLIETVTTTHKQVIASYDTEQDAWDQVSEIDEEGLRLWQVVEYDPEPKKEDDAADIFDGRATGFGHEKGHPSGYRKPTAHDRARFAHDDEMQKGE